jgi:transposase
LPVDNFEFLLFLKMGKLLFKEMIVELYQTGSSVADLSREYGVTKVTIYKWIKQYSEIKIDENTTVTKKEMLEIQKENNKLKEELAILKKALSIFADK